MKKIFDEGKWVVETAAKIADGRDLPEIGRPASLRQSTCDYEYCGCKSNQMTRAEKHKQSLEEQTRKLCLTITNLCWRTFPTCFVHFLSIDTMTQIVMEYPKTYNLLLGGVIAIDKAIFYNCALETIAVPISFFASINGVNGPKIDFTDFHIINDGQTIKFGDYEVASAAILYEFDNHAREWMDQDYKTNKANFIGDNLYSLEYDGAQIMCKNCGQLKDIKNPCNCELSIEHSTAYLLKYSGIENPKTKLSLKETIDIIQLIGGLKTEAPDMPYRVLGGLEGILVCIFNRSLTDISMIQATNGVVRITYSAEGEEDISASYLDSVGVEALVRGYLVNAITNFNRDRILPECVSIWNYSNKCHPNCGCSDIIIEEDLSDLSKDLSSKNLKTIVNETYQKICENWTNLFK